MSKYTIMEKIIMQRNSEMCAKVQPSAKAAIENLRKPIPIAKKIGFFIKNSIIKIARFQNCCSHPGEPGC